MNAVVMKLAVILIGPIATTIFLPLSTFYHVYAESVDLLYHKGTLLAEQDSLDAADAKFRAALEINPKHVSSYVGLGNVRLRLGDLKGAERAFRRALRWRDDYAPALNGLGNVFLRTKHELQWAIKYFQYACQAEKEYTDAYYNLALAYRMIRDTREIDAYKRLVKASPAHWDGWFQIGRIFHKGESGQSADCQKAELAYRRQIEVNPDHNQARVHLAEVLKDLNKTEEAVNVLTPIVEDVSNPYQYWALEELARVHQKRREHERSEALFRRYIDVLNSDEKEVYYDLRLVASGIELDRFRQAPRQQWKALSEAFWAGRDPAPVTAANERWIEHCRRVAYARRYFGGHRHPWDDRGEVYVRYGRPDHVSASNDIRFETHPKVLAVKERIMNQAGEALQHLLLSRRMVNFYADRIRGVREKGLDDRQTLSTILGHPVFPVRARGIWEYWIYTKVGGGIEITFVQEGMQGPYRYAESPDAGSHIWVDEITGRNPIAHPATPTFDDTENGKLRTDLQFESNMTWQNLSPNVVIDRVARKTPEVYEQDFATGSLDFYFDMASFKGEGGGPTLELYFGIPTRDLSYLAGSDGSYTAYLKRGLALYDEENRLVHRSVGDMELYSSRRVDTTELAFVPEMDRFSVAPGTYRLSVQILDTTSDKSQVYDREVVLSPYGENSLRVSDIEMAALIRPSRGSKFTKGDIEVVPNPSLAYLPGQPVFVYYEVYNLDKDEFGRTKYRVSYQLQSLEKGNVAVRFLTALGRMVGIDRTAEVVTVEYAHEGDKADEYGYLELDMSNTEPGRQMVTVSVVDDNTGQTTASRATFTIQ